MELPNFLSCFHDSVSQFLEEAHLSANLSVTINQTSTLPVKVSPVILASSLEKLVVNLQSCGVGSHQLVSLGSTLVSPQHSCQAVVRSKVLPSSIAVKDILNSAKSCTETKDSINQEVLITADPELVQIVASNSEIDRRIQAFMNRKKAEVDEANCREFCSSGSSGKQDSTCARTDSVFVSRNGSKSHVKVSRVAHAYGPQTRPHLIRAENVKVDMSSHRLPSKRDKNEGLEERLHSMESFLKIRQGQRVPEDVYERIKQLEERILHLESISPEYFSITPTAFKRQRLSQSTSEDTDLDDINKRIKQLEESLKRKKTTTTSTAEVKTSPT